MYKQARAIVGMLRRLMQYRFMDSTVITVHALLRAVFKQTQRYPAEYGVGLVYLYVRMLRNVSLFLIRKLCLLRDRKTSSLAYLDQLVQIRIHFELIGKYL